MYRYRRRHLKEDSENLDRWLISYADYMTLMFALFVVLYAISLVKQESFRTLSQSFSAMFSVPAEADETQVYLSDALLENQSDALLHGEGVLDTRGKKILDDESQLVNVDRELEGTPLDGLSDQLTATLSPLFEAGMAELSDSDEWLVLNLSSNLLFSSGSAYPSGNLQALVEVISDSLQESNNYIRVRGYTDSSPIGNELFSSNWLLSATRANVILEAMVKQGIDGRRLAVEAYGANFAVADNNTAEGRTRNRRVAVAISKWAAIHGDIADSSAAIKPVAAEPEPEPENLVDANNVADGSETTDAVELQGEPLNGSNQIRVISLPGGGIRITTLEESGAVEEGSAQ